MKSLLARRSFLKAAGLSFASFTGPVDRLLAAPPFIADDFESIKVNLLQMINEERAVARLGALSQDDLASQVATSHAADMLKGKFASHWGSDGLKPYQRYSFAGGIHASQENVSAEDNAWSGKGRDVLQDTAYMHVRLYQERPPDDGHRKAILAPQHTHVGFGIALDEARLRLVELFVGKYVSLQPLRQSAGPGQTLTVSGKLLRSKHSLSQIEVFYEPPPKPPDLEWLRQPRSYSLPKDSMVLWPRLEPPLMYADGRSGTVDLNPDGGFSARVRLFKSKPGIYTIVCWVKRTESERPFPATEVCVRAE